MLIKIFIVVICLNQLNQLDGPKVEPRTKPVFAKDFQVPNELLILDNDEPFTVDDKPFNFDDYRQY